MLSLFYRIYYQVPVYFKFVPKPEQTNYGPEWLTADPSTGVILMEHEATVKIQVIN